MRSGLEHRFFLFFYSYLYKGIHKSIHASTRHELPRSDFVIAMPRCCLVDGLFCPFWDVSKVLFQFSLFAYFFVTGPFFPLQLVLIMTDMLHGALTPVRGWNGLIYENEVGKLT